MNIYEDEPEEVEKNQTQEPVSEVLNAKFLKTRQILLSGEVNKQLAEKIVRQLLILEADSEEPIRIYIDSPGGDVDAGYAIFDMIRFVKCPVYCIGMGLVASAGALILLAADKSRRIGLPNSHYLIHQPLSGIKGVATDIEIHARNLVELKKRMNKLYSHHTGQKLSVVEKAMERDNFMTPEEALKFGLIDQIVANRAEIIAK